MKARITHGEEENAEKEEPHPPPVRHERADQSPGRHAHGRRFPEAGCGDGGTASGRARMLHLSLRRVFRRAVSGRHHRARPRGCRAGAHEGGRRHCRPLRGPAQAGMRGCGREKPLFQILPGDPRGPVQVVPGGPHPPGAREDRGARGPARRTRHVRRVRYHGPAGRIVAARHLNRKRPDDHGDEPERGRRARGSRHTSGDHDPGRNRIRRLCLRTGHGPQEGRPAPSARALAR
ncbi:MAG: hypothetical protein BWZ01_02887 [Deltaproteobacteria bacterium ADurb.BinA179]|nr:MAG: hypothetical protein BWZ01_02887 [Deltaproteobacteria bacterium ADurb.BinA179]